MLEPGAPELVEHLAKRREDAGRDERPLLGRNQREGVQPEGEVRVGGIEEDDIVAPVAWHEVEEALGEVAVRVEQGAARARVHLGDEEAFEERGLPRARLPEQVHVAREIARADTEQPPPGGAVVDGREDIDGVVVEHEA